MIKQVLTGFGASATLADSTAASCVDLELGILGISPFDDPREIRSARPVALWGTLNKQLEQVFGAAQDLYRRLEGGADAHAAPVGLVLAGIDAEVIKDGSIGGDMVGGKYAPIRSARARGGASQRRPRPAASPRGGGGSRPRQEPPKIPPPRFGPMPANASLNTISFRVYSEAQTLLPFLINALVKTLDHYGCGSQPSRDRFEHEVRTMLWKLRQPGAYAESFAKLKSVRGANFSDAKGAMQQVLMGFGTSESSASRTAEAAMSVDLRALRITRSADPKRFRETYNYTTWLHLNWGVGEAYDEGRALHGRLQDLLKEIAKPYRGRRDGVDEGLEQTCELVKLFPDIAEVIYVRAGLQGLTSFPPAARGATNSAADRFADAAGEWHDDETFWSFLGMAGLLIAGIAVTVISGGTLGPLAGTLVGAGIGLGMGTVNVVSAHNNLEFQRDAHRFGAASQARVDQAEGELAGAWGALAVDVATGGLLGRFGGGQGVSRLIRVVSISGAAGAVSTAVNPNVWRSENTAGLILVGTVVGMVGGGVGLGAEAGVARLVRGSTVRIGVGTATRKSLKVGDEVKIATSPDDPLVTAKVVDIQEATNIVRIRPEGGPIVDVKVERVDAIRPKTDGPLRPAQDGEIGDAYRPVYLEQDGQLLFGGARQVGKRTLFWRPGSTDPVRIDPRRLRIDPTPDGGAPSFAVLDPANPRLGWVDPSVSTGRLGASRYRIEPYQRDRLMLGSREVSTPDALLQPFAVRGDWRLRPTNDVYTAQLTKAVDTLAERIRNGSVSTFDDALRLMGAQTWKVNRRIPRTDLKVHNGYGIPGRVRKTGAQTGIGPHADAASTRAPEIGHNGDYVPRENGLPITGVLGPRWVHVEPRHFGELQEHLAGLWTRILREQNTRRLVDQMAEFHYYFAHMMPYDRGSAGAADAITKALFAVKGVRVGAWREGIAVDREAMVRSLPDFVATYPSFFQ